MFDIHIYVYISNFLKNCGKSFARCQLLFVVQSLSQVHLFATPWTAAHQGSTPGFFILLCLLEFA